MANEIERRRWNDAQMVANWPRRERFTDRISKYVIAAAAPAAGEAVLDVGSGGGKLGLAIAAAVGPRGKVAGADISQGMCDLASSRAADAGAKNASFRVTDVQNDAIKGGPFDLAVSQFGVMFFDEPVIAFTNIRSHLKPGGRLAFACWQPMAKNAWFLGPVVAPFAPPPPPPQPGKSPTGPFALGDPRRTRRLLIDAGFTGVTRTAHQLVAHLPADSVADRAFLAFSGVPEARLDEAEKALNVHLDRFREPGGLCRFTLAFQVFSARNG